MKHGVGFPIRPWKLQFDGQNCPISTINPSIDPWALIGDTDHTSYPLPTNPKHKLFWDSLILMIRSSWVCYKGGFVATAHGVGVEEALKDAFNESLLGDPNEWDGTPNQLELFICKNSYEAWRHLGSLLGFPTNQPSAPTPPVGDGYNMPTNLPLVHLPTNHRPGQSGIIAAPGGRPTNPEWTWHLKQQPLMSTTLVVYDNPVNWNQWEGDIPTAIRDLHFSMWPANIPTPPPPPPPPVDPDPPVPPVPPPPPSNGDVNERLDALEKMIDSRVNGLAQLFKERVVKLEGRVSRLERILMDVSETLMEVDDD